MRAAREEEGIYPTASLPADQPLISFTSLNLEAGGDLQGVSLRGLSSHGNVVPLCQCLTLCFARDQLRAEKMSGKNLLGEGASRKDFLPG